MRPVFHKFEKNWKFQLNFKDADFENIEENKNRFRRDTHFVECFYFYVITRMSSTAWTDIATLKCSQIFGNFCTGQGPGRTTVESKTKIIPCKHFHK